MNEILQKRIEEKSKELGQMFFPDNMNPWARPNWEAGYVETACKEVSNFILSNQWISVEEALPDYEEDVIVTNSYDDYWFAHRSNNEKVIVDEYGFARTPTVLRITHWMPIPSLEGDKK